MSLRFTFEPPPRVKLIRHQTINFFVSEPRIHFTKIKRQNIVKNETVSFPREEKREKERDRERIKEREKDKERDHERSSYSEKESSVLEKKTPSRQKATSFDKSFLGCNDLLQSIKSNKKLKGIFDLVGPVPNLPQIETNLLNCSYNSIDSFFRDLLDFFDGACESYITDDETQRAAANFLKKIEQEQGSLINRKPLVPFSDLQHQFQKFVDVQVPLPMQNNSTSSSSVSSEKLEKLAKDLNELDYKKKLKVEWLIRIQCPTLPYYSSGIDLVLLPETVINSIIQLIKAE